MASVAAPLLESEVVDTATISAAYDGLKRVLSAVAADGSRIQHGFVDGGLLENQYDASEQRVRKISGNSVGRLNPGQDTAKERIDFGSHWVCWLD